MAGFPGKKAVGIIRRDKRVMLTTSREDVPFVADHGSGDYAYDVDGNRFIDFSSFISVYNMGVNANKEIREAAKKQIDRLIHPAFTDYYSELPVAFAERLLDHMPSGFGRVFYSNSGTEANEAALKFARLFTKRQYSLSFYGAFHGRTMGSLSLTASKSVQREHFGPFPNVIHAPYAYCYRCPFGKEYPGCGMECVDYIKKTVLEKEASPKEFSSIFIEPVQGEGGYIVPPKEFVRGIREISEDNGILLVSDEVQSGYMRTGKFLATENFGVKSDIYTMAKSIAGGFPMGVTVTSSYLGDIPSGSHANTFGGNLVAIAAANASLTYLSRNIRSITKGTLEKGKRMRKMLDMLYESNEIIGDVRGIGMMVGVEFVRDRKTKEPAKKERDWIISESFRRGLLLLPAGQSTIRLIPPLTISSKSLETGLEIFGDVVREANASLKKGRRSL